MSSNVKDGAQSRAERTEAKIVAAAAELFLEHGYRGTTLTEVASAAGVSDRTIYVRFATKADLLNRVIDVLVVGDTKRISLARRDWVVTSMSAPSLEERVKADSSGIAALHARIGPLIDVAMQVAADEPVIGRAAQAARDATLGHIRGFWTALHADGLMHPDADLEWVIDTSFLLGNAETYVYMTRSLKWSSAEYERWHYRTWHHLATMPGPSG